VDLLRQSIVDLRRMLREGDVSPSDVAEAVVARISSADPGIDAYLETFSEELIEKAAAMTLSGDYRSKPLGGIPLAVKDNICIENKLLSCGSRILDGYTSPYSATVVDRLAEAGGLFTGRTRCDEFAMGSSTENCVSGPVKNPWDTTRVPGGSSGGSAAAVAAGMAFGALGSDTGGSVRQPASFCGVVGLKPTYGRVSRYGLVAFASSFDQIGPITRTVEDAALLLSVISGNDPHDSTSLNVDVPDYTKDLECGLDGLRLGVPRGFLENSLDESVRSNFEDLTGKLQSVNVEVRDVDMPHADYATAAYYIIANAEASANLARFDGLRYGRRADEPDDLYRMYVRSRGEGFGDEVKRRILLGTYVLSAGYYENYYVKAQKARQLICADFDSVFEKCDLLMLPTAPTPAFKLGEKTDDPVEMYQSDLLTIPANLAGLPAISLPSGLAPGRLPLGLQLVAQAGMEQNLLRAAHGLERLIDFGERPNG
jgi:aspartyl-tRNA(Asn)/glutamyl-tRNA(Gln) amidotransferase subunit A